ncbi:MAG: phosphatase PAP2 family protein [Lewinellaceae bacterium]|nr:phosphatase PAP2 family protein [Saprospiraceae bacterium]MCB9329697.1 phosphatase PAP2 family protein [Lewinellaceae bacterium]
MTWWQNLDITLFHYINCDWSNPFFDFLLPIWRERWTWIPLYILLVVLVFRFFRTRAGLAILLGLILAVGISDFTSSTLIKKNVQRLRPCNDPDVRTIVIQRIPCGSGYSFTSSHAANHFAVAVYMSLFLARFGPWVRPVLLLWAFLVAYAQVYVGVHYPGDIIGGAVLGSGIAWITGLFIRRKTQGLKV